MQPGCEHRRSASKRVVRRGSAEIRAPWIGPPTMANGPLPLESHGRTDTGNTYAGYNPDWPWFISGGGADRVHTRERRRTSSVAGGASMSTGPDIASVRAGGGNRTLDHSLTKR